MSNYKRDNAAEKYAAGFERRYIAIGDFRAGWDACADDVEREIADRAFECLA